jgi:cytochrome c-type biogenesis protein CcmH
MLWFLFAAAAVMIVTAAWYLARPLATGAQLRGDEQRHQLELTRARLLGQLNELDAARADRGIDATVAQDEALRLDAELLQVLKDIEALPPPATGVIHGETANGPDLTGHARSAFGSPPSPASGRGNEGEGARGPRLDPIGERRRWWAALAVLVLALPLIAAGLYGMQQAPLLGALMRLADGGTPSRASLPPEALKMVERLENRLREQPNDPTGWAQLGRSYTVMERRSDAQAAYAKAHELAPANPEILSDYAWLLFSDNPDYTEGPAKALYERLLALDANHPDALWFLGLSAYNKSDAKQAIRYWERLTKVLPPDNPALPEVRKAIAKAQGQQ